MAAEVGHVGGVYLANHVPMELIPRGKKSIALWIEGFATIFHVIHTMFEAGEIPKLDALERALVQLPKDKQKLIKAYGKQGAEVGSVLEALIRGAQDEWEQGDFQAAHCIEEDWDALPTCDKHDQDWNMAVDQLVE
jgi:hypothetical protein